MTRTHWTVEEFWQMFEPTHYLAAQLGGDQEEIELTKEAAVRFWLMFIPAAGSA